MIEPCAGCQRVFDAGDMEHCAKCHVANCERCADQGEYLADDKWLCEECADKEATR